MTRSLTVGRRVGAAGAFAGYINFAALHRWLRPLRSLDTIVLHALGVLAAALALCAAPPPASATVLPSSIGYINGYDHIGYPTAQDACDAFLTVAQNEFPGSYFSVKLRKQSLWLYCFALHADETEGWYAGIGMANPTCPALSSFEPYGRFCNCVAGAIEDPGGNACVMPELGNGTSDDTAGPVCRADGIQVGNPIIPASGEKYLREVDYVESGPGPLSFARIYRSSRSFGSGLPTGALGGPWTHNHELTLKAVGLSYPAPYVVITDPEGSARTFKQTSYGANTWTGTFTPDTLRADAGLWTYRRADDDSTFRFDGSGRLLSHASRNGWTTSYTYNSSGRLSLVTGPFGRAFTLSYNAAGHPRHAGPADRARV
ncbi:MAG: hypothetical protein KKC79_20450, partial [Gammaproteobacteria bacterium]|nr:hypothetical protein [Gammaproteobacteria bacterium]